MKGFPDSFDDFKQAKQQQSVSVDSATVFKATREDPTVKAVLAELRHTCYHGVFDYGPGVEPVTFGHHDKFADVKHDAEMLFDANIRPGHRAESVRIFDAMGALIWSKEREPDA